MIKKIMILFILLTAYAYADSETQSSGSYDQGTNWSNPSNITGTDNGTCALYNNGNQDIITVYNLKFALVAGTVDSIVPTFHGYGTQAQGARREIEYQLTKTGGGANTSVGDLQENIRFGQSVGGCGGATDITVSEAGLHGTTWTPAEITATGFGLNIADDDGTAHELGIDAVSVTVWYTPDAVAGGQVIIITGGN